MDTETTAVSPSRRPRTSLLVLLGIVLVGAGIYTFRDSADPAALASNPRRPQAQAGGGERQLDPKQLEVKLEALKEEQPSPDDTERNPFRFRPKPPPPPPPGPPPGARPPVTVPQTEMVPQEKPIPPIPLKFIGVTEAPGIGKIAALSDCRHTVQGKEGDEVDGRYRIVKIGVESLIIEYLDGKGRTTLRMSGQDCVAK
jgi:hypothetical protein